MKVYRNRRRYEMVISTYRYVMGLSGNGEDLLGFFKTISKYHQHPKCRTRFPQNHFTRGMLSCSHAVTI